MQVQKEAGPGKSHTAVPARQEHLSCSSSGLQLRLNLEGLLSRARLNAPTTSGIACPLGSAMPCPPQYPPALGCNALPASAVLQWPFLCVACQLRRTSNTKHTCMYVCTQVHVCPCVMWPWIMHADPDPLIPLPWVARWAYAPSNAKVSMDMWPEARACAHTQAPSSAPRATLATPWACAPSLWRSWQVPWPHTGQASSAACTWRRQSTHATCQLRWARCARSCMGVCVCV